MGSHLRVLRGWFEPGHSFRLTFMFYKRFVAHFTSSGGKRKIKKGKNGNKIVKCRSTYKGLATLPFYPQYK